MMTDFLMQSGRYRPMHAPCFCCCLAVRAFHPNCSKRLSRRFLKQLLTATLAVDAFLQVGDMCHYRSFARPVHWIYGNNDWPDVVRQVETGERPLQHLYHIKTGEILTLSHGAEHVRIAGLNGAFEDLYYDLAPTAER